MIFNSRIGHFLDLHDLGGTTSVWTHASNLTIASQRGLHDARLEGQFSRLWGVYCNCLTLAVGEETLGRLLLLGLVYLLA